MVGPALGLDGAADVEAGELGQQEGEVGVGAANEGARQTQTRGGLEDQETLTAGELALLEEFRLSGFYDPWQSDETTSPSAPTTAEATEKRWSHESTTPSAATTTITIPSAASSVEPIGVAEETDEREAVVGLFEVVGASPERQVDAGELRTIDGDEPPPQPTAAESTMNNEQLDGVRGEGWERHKENPVVSDLESDF